MSGFNWNDAKLRPFFVLSPPTSESSGKFTALDIVPRATVVPDTLTDSGNARCHPVLSSITSGTMKSVSHIGRGRDVAPPQPSYIRELAGGDVQAWRRPMPRGSLLHASSDHFKASMMSGEGRRFPPRNPCGDLRAAGPFPDR